MTFSAQTCLQGRGWLGVVPYFLVPGQGDEFPRPCPSCGCAGRSRAILLPSVLQHCGVLCASQGGKTPRFLRSCCTPAQGPSPYRSLSKGQGEDFVPKTAEHKPARRQLTGAKFCPRPRLSTRSEFCSCLQVAQDNYLAFCAPRVPPWWVRGPPKLLGAGSRGKKDKLFNLRDA